MAARIIAVGEELPVGYFTNILRYEDAPPQVQRSAPTWKANWTSSNPAKLAVTSPNPQTGCTVKGVAVGAATVTITDPADGSLVGSMDFKIIARPEVFVPPA